VYKRQEQRRQIAALAQQMAQQQQGQMIAEQG
jgi:hypothetical protein